jgi:hemoglobin
MNTALPQHAHAGAAPDSYGAPTGAPTRVSIGKPVALPVLAATPNQHFARIGGREPIAALVQAFYRAMDTRPDAAAIRAMHDPDLRRTKAVLVDYLCEWMGGPRNYSAQRGTPMLRRRHQPFDIDSAARDAWMACMRQALDECQVEPGLRAELDAAFWKIADFIRNTEPAGERRPHPGRPMETHPHATPATHASAAASAGPNPHSAPAASLTAGEAPQPQ